MYTPAPQKNTLLPDHDLKNASKNIKLIHQHLYDSSHTPQGGIIETFRIPFSGAAELTTFKPQTKLEFNLQKTD